MINSLTVLYFFCRVAQFYVLRDYRYTSPNLKVFDVLQAVPVQWHLVSANPRQAY